MRCQDFREMMDSYLGDELLVETNHEVLRHLESCPACRNEFAARRRLLAQMRSAVKSLRQMQLNPAFARRVRNDLRETALRPSVWEKLKSGEFTGRRLLAATAVCLLLMALVGVVWFNRLPAENITVSTENQTNKLSELSLPSESPITKAVQVVWREMIRAAADDHENCALHYRLKEDPITLEEAAEKYGKFNKDLDKAVIASLPREISDEKVSGKTTGKLEFLDAHSCVFNGRRFTHIELQSGNKIISVIITDAEDLSGENDRTIANQAEGNFQVAGFRTARHAVFVVSDLSEAENLTIADTLFPAIHRHIKQAEA